VKRDLGPTYQTLDAIVVVATLIIVGGGVAGLMFLNVPSDNLPIVAGLLGTMLGTLLGGYAGFRWGASTTKGEPQAVRVENPPDRPVPTVEV
jgi:hypothetical protein